MVTSFIKNYALLVFLIANLNDVVVCDSNLKEIKYDEYQVTIYRDMGSATYLWEQKIRYSLWIRICARRR